MDLDSGAWCWLDSSKSLISVKPNLETSPGYVFASPALGEDAHSHLIDSPIPGPKFQLYPSPHGEIYCCTQTCMRAIVRVGRLRKHCLRLTMATGNPPGIPFLSSVEKLPKQAQKGWIPPSETLRNDVLGN